MAEIKNIDRLPEFVRSKVASYSQKLVSIHGSNLLSLAVYGSAAAGDFIPRRSDINLVVILKHLTFEDLKKSLYLVREGEADNITAPLFLTPEYIRQSLDVFPVEFLDLRERHVLIYGEDMLSSMDVDDRHLRLFCEEQIKGKLLRVRQAYLETGLDPKGQEEILKNSLASLLPALRNLLRLAHQPLPSSKEDVLKALGRHYGIDAGVLVDIHRDRTRDEKIAGQEIEHYLQKYIDILEKLAVKVD